MEKIRRILYMVRNNDDGSMTLIPWSHYRKDQDTRNFLNWFESNMNELYTLIEESNYAGKLIQIPEEYVTVFLLKAETFDG